MRTKFILETIINYLENRNVSGFDKTLSYQNGFLLKSFEEHEALKLILNDKVDYSTNCFFSFVYHFEIHFRGGNVIDDLKKISETL